MCNKDHSLKKKQTNKFNAKHIVEKLKVKDGINISNKLNYNNVAAVVPTGSTFQLGKLSECVRRIIHRKKTTKIQIQ